MGKQVSSGKVSLFRKYIVLDFENLVFKILVFGDGLQVLEVLRLKSSSTVIRLTGNFPSASAWLYITTS